MTAPRCCRFALGALYLLLGATGCFGGRGVVPADMRLLVDAESAHDPGEHVNVRVAANGEGQYDRYRTGGAIRSDTSGMVIYEPNQVTESGSFQLDRDALRRLWVAIKDNRFFELTGDYRMAMGFSYAFIIVDADGRRYRVFNIGMEVPEIRALLEDIETELPPRIDLEYREGSSPANR